MLFVVPLASRGARAGQIFTNRSSEIPEISLKWQAEQNSFLDNRSFLKEDNGYRR